MTGGMSTVVDRRVCQEAALKGRRDYICRRVGRTERNRMYSISTLW